MDIKKRTYRVKIGHGKHHVRSGKVRKTILPGETFEAYPHEIEGFEQKFEVVEAGEVVSVEEAKLKEELAADNKEEVSELIAVHVGGGRYNVLNADGEKLNDATLSKEEAQSLISGDVPKEEEKEEEEESKEPAEEEEEKEEEVTDKKEKAEKKKRQKI